MSASLTLDAHQWLHHITLRTDVGCRVGFMCSIPNGQYTMNIDVTSSADCAGGSESISGAYDVDYENARPVIQLVWDPGRGNEPDDLMVSPGSAVRDPATGAIAAWRIRPADSGNSHTGNFYEDVGVRLYVAEKRARLDWDGYVVEDLVPVEGVELCIGVVHRYYEPGTPAVDEITVSCEPSGLSVVTLGDPDGPYPEGADTEPENAWATDLTEFTPSQGDVGEAEVVRRCPTSIRDNLDTKPAQITDSTTNPWLVDINPTRARSDDSDDSLVR